MTTVPDHLSKSPTSIERLDQVLHGGLPTGRPTLIAGGPGCGKTLFALACLVLDSVDSLVARFGDERRIRQELDRHFHWVRERGLATVATSEARTRTLTRHGIEDYVADCGMYLDHRVRDQISKLLVDTWLVIRFIKKEGQRRRVFFVRKSRGMPHVDADAEMRMSDRGVEVRPLMGASSAPPTGPTWP